MIRCGYVCHACLCVMEWVGLSSVPLCVIVVRTCVWTSRVVGKSAGALWLLMSHLATSLSSSGRTRARGALGCLGGTSRGTGWGTAGWAGAA